MGDDTLTLIDKIIEEHQEAFVRFKDIDGLCSDAAAVSGIDEAKEAFIPGRLDREQGLQKLLELLETIDQGLLAHFDREETALLLAFEIYGDSKLVSALNALIAQHAEFRNRLAHSKKHVAELMSGSLARHKWEASAQDMRAYVSHTKRLIEGHAAGELPLLRELRKRLVGEAGGQSRHNMR